MKQLLLLCLIGFACNGQTKFVKISPEMGAIELMTESGEFGKPGITQIYFVSFIKERNIEMKEGFLVIKLERVGTMIPVEAYELLDSFLLCEKAFRVDISESSNWSASDKEQWKKLREISYEVRHRFFNRVKFKVEIESLKTGISKKAFLSYE